MCYQVGQSEDWIEWADISATLPPLTRFLVWRRAAMADGIAGYGGQVLCQRLLRHRLYHVHRTLPYRHTELSRRRMLHL